MLRSINRSGCFVLPTVQVTAFIVYSRPFRLLRLNKLFKLGGPRPVPAAGGVKRAQMNRWTPYSRIMKYSLSTKHGASPASEQSLPRSAILEAFCRKSVSKEERTGVQVMAGIHFYIRRLRSPVVYHKPYESGARFGETGCLLFVPEGDGLACVKGLFLRGMQSP